MGLAEGGIPRAKGCSDTPIPGEPVLPQNCCEPVLEGRGSPASVYQDVSEEEECIVTLWASKGQEPVRRSVGPRESGTPPTLLMGFLGGPGGKELSCQHRRLKETLIQSLVWEDPLEEGVATHSSILAWRIPRTEEPGGL